MQLRGDVSNAFQKRTITEHPRRQTQKPVFWGCLYAKTRPKIYGVTAIHLWEMQEEVHMHTQKIGYARVSTLEQNLDRQLDLLKAQGVDKIYTEKMSGTKRERPELSKLLDRMEPGDTVVIESLSRLGRSTKDLIELVELFREREVQLVSLKEQIDTSTSTGKLLFTLMAALAQFERDVLADRTREGLKAARARGHFGGRPKTDPRKLAQAAKLYHAGQHTVKEIEELTGVKRSTLYRAVGDRR